MASPIKVGRGHLNWLRWKAHSLFIFSLYSSAQLHLNDLGTLFTTFMRLYFISYSWNSELASSLLILESSACITSLLSLAFKRRKYFIAFKLLNFMLMLTAIVKLYYSYLYRFKDGEAYMESSLLVNLIGLVILKRSG